MNHNIEKEINETLKIAGIQLNEEEKYDDFSNITVGDIVIMNDTNEERKVTEVDTSYGKDKYGNPAVYVTLDKRFGIPSSALKYIAHKK